MPKCIQELLNRQTQVRRTCSFQTAFADGYGVYQAGIETESLRNFDSKLIFAHRLCANHMVNTAQIENRDFDQQRAEVENVQRAEDDIGEAHHRLSRGQIVHEVLSQAAVSGCAPAVKVHPGDKSGGMFREYRLFTCQLGAGVNA